MTADTEYQIAPDIQADFEKLLDAGLVKKGLGFLEADHESRIAEQIAITEIPASFEEETVRAEEYARRMQELGLKNVHLDEAHNAIGYWNGTGERPLLVVSAHLDTVFPSGYDAKVSTDEQGRLHAPGIADDGSGLSALLSIVRALKTIEAPLIGDIMFVGDVGEEGRGDLRGMKHLFASNQGIDGFISIDSTGATNIIYQGLGSKRFECVFRGPGGHSYGAFGDIPSPIHAMGRAISKIADIQTPETPRTTFTVSVVNGGTSINSIAAEAIMQTDTRSETAAQLDATVSELINAVKMAVIEENARWTIPWDSTDNITVDITLVGDRPGGMVAADARHVQAAYLATCAINQAPELEGPGSTDANIPILLGIPALTLGAGGEGCNIHSLDEYYDPTEAYLGPQRILLTLLSLVGVEGLTAPVLTPHPGYTYKA